MAFKNRTQGGSVAADILRDMPVEAMQMHLRQMAQSTSWNSTTAYPSFAQWLVNALEWRIEWDELVRIEWDELVHGIELRRAQEKAQERIDELTQEWYGDE